ncbi:MAG: hypothetical protein ABIS45_12270 [Burkholderiales bacterium]
MSGRLRIHSANWLTGGVHVIILALAAHAESSAVWPYALGAMSLVSFAAWIGNHRRYLQIAGTPLSNIASAAQGYVEIAGQAEMPAGTPFVSKLSLTPCVWYQYQIEEKNSNNEWSLHDSGASDELFIVRDKTGECVIDPEGAETLCSRRNTWTHGDYRYVEWLLLPRETVYALGEFATIGGANSELDLDADVGALLAEWKMNQPALLQRFDLNQSGSIDVREWGLARRQAVREVQAHHREIRASTGTNMLRAPADGRLFLISNYLPAKARLRYMLWAWAHAAIFIGAGAGAFALKFVLR